MCVCDGGIHKYNIHLVIMRCMQARLINMRLLSAGLSPQSFIVFCSLALSRGALRYAFSLVVFLN